MHYLTCLPLPISIRLKFFRKKKAKALFGRQRTSQVRWYLSWSWTFALLDAKQHENKARRFSCQQHLQVFEGVLGISSKTAQPVKCTIHPHSLFTFDFPGWSLKAVKTLRWSFQRIIDCRRPKFWLLSCLQNQKGFPPRSSRAFSSCSTPYFGEGLYENICGGKGG